MLFTHTSDERPIPQLAVSTAREIKGLFEQKFDGRWIEMTIEQIGSGNAEAIEEGRFILLDTVPGAADIGWKISRGGEVHLYSDRKEPDGCHIDTTFLMFHEGGVMILETDKNGNQRRITIELIKAQQAAA